MFIPIDSTTILINNLTNIYYYDYNNYCYSKLPDNIDINSCSLELFTFEQNLYNNTYYKHCS